MTSELESHMIRELYRSVCDPENPERLERVVPLLSERVTKLETKVQVAGTFGLALMGIGGAVVGAWHRIVK